MTDTYLESILGERENILLVTRQHWFVLFAAIVPELAVIIGLATLATIAITFLPALPLIGIVGYFLIIIPVISLIRDSLFYYNQKYIVTNRRVIQISGVINKNVIDSNLEKVNDVKMVQTFFGRIFNYGDIEILTASELGANLFRRIGDPKNFKTAMLNAKEKMEGYGNPSSPINLPVQPLQPREDIPALIEKLDQLRRNGIISEEEFQRKKNELMAKI